MRRRLFLIHFKNAIAGKFVVIVSVYLVLLLVERIVASRGLDRLEVALAFNAVLTWLWLVSAYLDGATAFSREFKKRTSHFVTTLPIARLQVWFVVLAAEILSLNACWMFVFVTRMALAGQESFSEFSMAHPWLLILILPAIAILTGLASSCFSLVFENPAWNMATGLLVSGGMVVLLELVRVYFIGPFSPGESPSPVLGVLPLLMVFSSASWFRRGEFDLSRRQWSSFGVLAAAILAIAWILVPAAMTMDRARTSWDVQGAQLSNGNRVVITERREPYRGVRLRIVDLESGANILMDGQWARAHPYRDFLVVARGRLRPSNLIRLLILGALEPLLGIRPDRSESLESFESIDTLERLDESGQTKWEIRVPGARSALVTNDGVLLLVSRSNHVGTIRVVDQTGVARTLAEGPAEWGANLWPAGENEFLVRFFNRGLPPTVWRVEAEKATQLRAHPTKRDLSTFRSDVFENTVYSEEDELIAAVVRRCEPFPEPDRPGALVFRSWPEVASVFYVVARDSQGSLYGWTGGGGWQLIDDRVLITADDRNRLAAGNHPRSLPGLSHVLPGRSWLPNVTFVAVEQDAAKIKVYDPRDGSTTTAGTIPRESYDGLSANWGWYGAGWISLEKKGREPAPPIYRRLLLHRDSLGFIPARQEDGQLLGFTEDGRQIYLSEDKTQVITYFPDGSERRMSLVDEAQ